MADLITVIVFLMAVGAFLSSQSALKASRNAETEIRYLRRRLEAAESEMVALRARHGAMPSLDAATPPPPPTEPIPEPQPAAEAERRPEAIAADAEPDTALESESKPEPQRAAAAMMPAAAAKSAPAFGLALEKHFTENWLVWLGGITLALGGAFLVKYSIDQGWFGPTVRVFMGVLLGLTLVAGGEALARREEPLELSGINPSDVPPALVGAGSAIVFASVYAAFALYDLLPPLLAFAILAASSAGTVLLALRHGPFVALLGLVGAHAVPLLVQTGHPNAWLLFAYLLLLDSSALGLARWKGWWRVGWSVAAAAAGWVLIWLAQPFTRGDEIPVGMFLLALFGLTVALRRGIPALPWLAEPATTPAFRQLVMGTGIGAAVLCCLMVVVAGHSAAAVAVMLAYGAAVMTAARLDADYDRLPVGGALLGLLTLASWDLPHRMVSFDLLRPVIPDHAVSFGVTAGLLAALFGLGGFAAQWGAARPGRWAALSAGVPVAVLAESYWRLSSIGVDLAWAACALCLAGLLLIAAERLARWRNLPGMEEALAAYAVGVLAALALAFTIALESAWLTVALALLLPGIAWVDRRLHVARLRDVALIVAAIVLVRLALNPYLLDYPIGTTPVVNWLLYGYGVPMLAFAGAAWLFRRDADDLLVQVLEAGAVLFLVLLVSLEIHHANTGSLRAVAYDLAEQSLHSLAWLTIATGLGRARNRLVPFWTRRLLIGLATAQVVVLQLLASNPLLTNQPVGDTLVFNTLLLAYGLPAALYAVLAVLERESLPLRQALQAMALTLAFAWISFEVRHAFVGPRLAEGGMGATQVYTYSALWLSLAIGLSRLRGWLAAMWAQRLLLGLATTQVLLGHLVILNPWMTNAAVGTWPIFNTLLLAYLLPAGLYMVLSRLHGLQQRPRQLLEGMALLLTLAWITLEVRHAFVGSRMARVPVGTAELYTYSAAWLIYAGALLGAGLRWGSDALRHAGLGILLLVVLKVFLVDMARLTGLWRALSFIGLGLALIGVGYLYRRFVRVASARSDAPS